MSKEQEFLTNSNATKRFISFEGGEGAGKTTQIRLLAARLKMAGYVVCCLREPGGTDIGEQIRQILLNPANISMAPLAELMLYQAARAQLIAEVICPALDEGKVVLVDRFFDSTTAYQAYARGIDRDIVDAANAIGTDGLVPSRTILLTQDVNIGLQKATQEGADRLEAEGQEFHAKVHDGFADLARSYSDRIVVVPCQEKKGDTHELIFAAVADLFNKKAAEPFEVTEQLLQETKNAG